MRLVALVLALACLLGFAFAWDKEDYEIFDLQEAVEKAEGKGTTFYSWLDVSSTSSSAEIAKAYRKKSLELHPDKNPGVKGISERYARLGVVQKILRSEGRQRYDFFNKNGFPRWRGTGYYYSRFRPGLGTAVIFLALVTAGLQHIVQRMNYSRDVARIDRIIEAARRQAWGPKLIKIDGRRKVRVNIGGSAVHYDEDGNEYGGGKYLEMVVEGDKVFLLEGDGELTPLDASAATYPSWSRTWPAALALSIYARIAGKSQSGAESGAEDDAAAKEEVEVDSDEVPNGAAAGGGNGVGKPTAATKAGGTRRRKPARK